MPLPFLWFPRSHWVLSRIQLFAKKHQTGNCHADGEVGSGGRGFRTFLRPSTLPCEAVVVLGAALSQILISIDCAFDGFD